MKNTPTSRNALPGLNGNAPSRPIHQWILVALFANAVLLSVIALQIKQVGNQLAGMANQNNAPASGHYAYSGMPISESPYCVSFAKNDGYTAYRVSNSDPIPVRIVGTPIPVEVKESRWDPIVVKVAK